MTYSKKNRTLARLAIVLTALVTINSVQATLMVNAIVTPVNGGLFNYGFSVTNSGAEDVSIVSITDAPFDDANIETSLVAPTDFMASYDPNLGIVDFLEASDLFAIGTTTTGFAFDSTAGPNSNFLAFEALTVDGNVISGQIQRDIRPDGVVPEPGTVVLLAFGLGCLALKSLRKEEMTM